MHWLFDYDLTLYGHDERHVLTELDRNISRFIVARFGISEVEADRLRQQYWEQHGTTLNGLRAHHSVPPDEYFDFIHQGENIRLPAASPEKRQLLQSLPGTLWIFTNARRDWAELGLKAMGLEDCFAGIFDISSFGWESKPNPSVYQEVEKRIGPSNRAVVLLDDSLANLATAKNRGWQTVLVHPDCAEMPADCDLRVKHILELKTTWQSLAL